MTDRDTKLDSLIIVLESVRFRSTVRSEIPWLTWPVQWGCSASKTTDQCLILAECIVESQVRSQPQPSKTTTPFMHTDASKLLPIKTISLPMDRNNKTCKFSSLLTSRVSRTNLQSTYLTSSRRLHAAADIKESSKILS